jgi:arylformamidase
MRFFDVSRIIEPDMAVYPGDLQPAFSTHGNGDARVTSLQLGTHTGTHIDAPSHYLTDGTTIDNVPLGHCIGECSVIDCSSLRGELSAGDLPDTVRCVKRVLVKTAYLPRSRFDSEYPHLSPDAARHLVSAGVKCIGIDSPSVEKFSGDGAVHRILLSAGLVIIEWLDLSSVPAGNYTMIALPLRLGGLDGSPARVVLMVP